MKQLSTAPNFPASIVQLGNGLTVIHQEVVTTPVVVADVWVEAGSCREPALWSGMAHFLEHMIFKGTERIPPGVFDYAIETQGGMTNAATSHDYAHFFLTIAAEALDQTLPYLADLLIHAAIPADEFIRERSVVLEEIHQAQDDPDWLGFQCLSELVYGDHAYGRPVLGTEYSLGQQSPEEMRCFHQNHYQPGNMAVVITGGISLESAVKAVQQNFRGFSPLSDHPEVSAVPLPQLGTVHKEVLHLPRLEQSRLTMAWLGPGTADLEAAFGLDLIAVILGEGRSSRLVQELREDKQLVQDVGASFSLQRDCSLFTIQAWLDRDVVDRVEAIIGDRLTAFVEQPLLITELNRAKRLLCNDYAFSTETPGQLAGLYGYYHTLGYPRHCVLYSSIIQSHTEASLKQLAARYLTPLRYASVTLHPA